jgi:hypothetical protein
MPAPRKRPRISASTTQANAGGRLVGILLSGVLTQVGGLAACLWGSAAMLALCLAITFLLPSVAAARRAPA